MNQLVKDLWVWLITLVSSKEFIIALMVLVGTIMTIQGGIEGQRVLAVRNMKQTYYNQFSEAYSNKLIADSKVSSETQTEAEKKLNAEAQIEAEKEFNIEVNRLPLYASQEMIEYINELKNPIENKQYSAKEFYEIMRRDLCSDKFVDFNELPEDISFSVPRANLK